MVLKLERNKLVKLGFVILTVVCICLAYYCARFSNENSQLKKNRGEMVNNYVSNVLYAVDDAEEDVGKEDIVMTKIYRDYWKFNEYSIFVPGVTWVTWYSLGIQNEFGELIRLEENKQPQSEINTVKSRLKIELSKFNSALVLIHKECGNDSLKYYQFSTGGNENLENQLTKLLIEQ